MNQSEALTLMKLNNHKFAYCSHCKTAMIVCGKCGNNCCNGGTKPECPDGCSEAYEIQDTIELNCYPLKYRILCWFHDTIGLKVSILQVKLYDLTHRD